MSIYAVIMTEVFCTDLKCEYITSSLHILVQIPKKDKNRRLGHNNLLHFYILYACLMFCGTYGVCVIYP